MAIAGGLLQLKDLVLNLVALHISLHRAHPRLLKLVPVLMLVPALTEVPEALIEAREAFLKDVHLGEEKFRILFHVNVPVELSEGSPEHGSTPLAKLAVEHNNSAIEHHLPDFVSVSQESLLQKLSVVNVYGTLYVTKCEFIVKSAVYDDDRMRLTSDQISQSLTIDRVAGG